MNQIQWNRRWLFGLGTSGEHCSIISRYRCAATSTSLRDSVHRARSTSSRGDCLLWRESRSAAASASSHCLPARSMPAAVTLACLASLFGNCGSMALSSVAWQARTKKPAAAQSPAGSPATLRSVLSHFVSPVNLNSYGFICN